MPTFGGAPFDTDGAWAEESTFEVAVETLSAAVSTTDTAASATESLVLVTADAKRWLRSPLVTHVVMPEALAFTVRRCSSVMPEASAKPAAAPPRKTSDLIMSFRYPRRAPSNRSTGSVHVTSGRSAAGCGNATGSPS